MLAGSASLVSTLGPIGERPHSEYDLFLQAVNAGCFVYSSVAFMKQYQSKSRVRHLPCRLSLSYTPKLSELRVYVEKVGEMIVCFMELVPGRERCSFHAGSHPLPTKSCLFRRRWNPMS